MVQANCLMAYFPIAYQNFTSYILLYIFSYPVEAQISLVFEDTYNIDWNTLSTTHPRSLSGGQVRYLFTAPPVHTRWPSSSIRVRAWWMGFIVNFMTSRISLETLLGISRSFQKSLTVEDIPTLKVGDTITWAVILNLIKWRNWLNRSLYHVTSSPSHGSTLLPLLHIPTYC